MSRSSDHVVVRSKPAEVELLLEPPITHDLRGCSAEAAKSGVGEHVRNDDPTRQAKAEMVRRLVLVVHHRHGWNSRRPRRDDLCVRAVRERDVRASPLREAYKLRVRAANVVALCNRPGGLPPPIGVTSGHCSRARSSVCAWSRAVKTTSQPSRRSRSTTGVNTSTWGVFARSIHTRRRWVPVTRWA